MKPNTDTHKISVYTASAGSGKTYTLTRAYIRLAVTGEPWHARQAAAILAITFTNAAAADMKRKIMETLAQMASGADAAADLQAGSGLSAKQLKERTGAVLHYLLHDYGNFSVQTIDSFVQRVIRPFAFELGLPRTYETDIETDRWVEEIREALLAAYGTADQEMLTRLLDGFLEEMAENEDKGRMEIIPALNRVLGMAFEEKSEANLMRLSARDESRFLQEVEGFGQRRRACEKAALAIYKEMSDLIKAEGLEAGDFHGKSTGFWTFFKKPLRDGRAVLRAFIEGEGKSNWRKTVEKGFLTDASRGGAAAALQRLYEQMQALDTARYVYEAALEKNLYALALMKRADDLKNHIQQAEGRVPISEFNRKIHALLAQTDVPYLYERVGAVYRHILVDEFQDTSTLQWENLRPLIDNNRAAGYWNMVVGDPKQSIYRFRSANVEQMLALREDAALAQNEKLVSNWRSDAGIIAFNNLFYRFLLEGFEPEKAENADEWARIRMCLKRIYTEHEQFYKTATDRLPAEDAQAVRVCFYDKHTGTDDGGGEGDNISYEDWNCRLIEDILKRHQPGDVAVLCTRNDRVKEVASYLVEHGVKVHTDSSLLLRSSLTVRLLVAALRYMGMPDSDTARRKLRWFLAQQAEADGTPAGDEDTRLRYLRGLADSGRSLYDKLQHILRMWALRAETDQYVLSFMDLVQQSLLRTEADFVREWEDNWAETSMVQTAAGRADAVRVTTVHKSKGLEYPVVIYAFASDAPRPDGWVWTELPSKEGLPVGLLSLKDAAAQTVDEAAVDEAADERMKAVVDRINVLYVTTTRPRHRLYVLSKGTKGSGAYAENRYWEQFVKAYPAYLAADTEWKEDGAAASAAEASSAAAAGDTAGEEAARMAAARRDMAARQTDWMPRFEPAFSWRDTLRRPERIWGEFIHRVLSGIDDARRFDRAAVEAVVAEQWPAVAPWLHDGYEASAAVAQVEAVLAHPSLRPCFSADYRIYNECELCCDGQIYRPDRVAVGANDVYVIDYKTGEAHAEHVRQVEAYRDLLFRKEAKPIHVYIVYISDGSVEVKEVQ